MQNANNQNGDGLEGDLYTLRPRLLLQDIFNALLLSESVYKVADFGSEAAARIAQQLAAQLPQGASHDLAVL